MMDLFVLYVWLPGTGWPGEGLSLVGQEREAGLKEDLKICSFENWWCFTLVWVGRYGERLSCTGTHEPE